MPHIGDGPPKLVPTALYRDVLERARLKADLAWLAAQFNGAIDFAWAWETLTYTEWDALSDKIRAIREEQRREAG